MYEDNTTDAEGGLAELTKDDYTPVMDTVLDREIPLIEENDNYVNYLVVLPRFNTYSRGKVIGCKRYSDGNVIGRVNDNPLFVTREYCVEFDDMEVSILTANVIAESMYAACDDNGN